MSSRVWFVSDLHGSTVCFKKFLNSINTKKAPDVLIIGGDITGKQIIPVVESANYWKASLEGMTHKLPSIMDVEQFLSFLADKGAYGYPCSETELKQMQANPAIWEEIAHSLIINRLYEWLDLADDRLKHWEGQLIINGGNDDPFFIDEILRSTSLVIHPEGQVVEIAPDIEMISCGWSNPTPWQCPREVDDKELGRVLEKQVSKLRNPELAVFNFHAPPFQTPLDIAPLLDAELRPVASGLGPEQVHVGSRSVRKIIEKYQPLVSLHGHVHEQHTFTSLGKTLCFNPGSEYYEGRLQGVFLEFDRGTLIHWGLTREGG
ncbi:metallophosphoesterase [Gemmatimonadota bacterium]